MFSKIIIAYRLRFEGFSLSIIKKLHNYPLNHVIDIDLLQWLIDTFVTVNM
jgi:hypothetical protein